MEALKKKWNSCRGASILLALLFLLVCMMAGASILMAGASNAGKIRSNKEEQQKYLALSSALNLMIDELESVEYVGKYTYVVNSEQKPVYEKDPESGEEVTDEAGNKIILYYKYYATYTYTRGDGVLQYRNDSTLLKNDWTGTGTETDMLDKVLPLNQDLDKVFADAIRNKYTSSGNYQQIDSTHYEKYTYIPDPPSSTAQFTGKYTLTLTVAGVGDPVQIDVELKEDGRIFLTATLMEKKTDPSDSTKYSWEPTKYTMNALLRPDPNEWPEKQFVLKSSSSETVPIRWKLDHIYKEEAVSG